MTVKTTAQPSAPMNPMLKLALELGPLGLFFVAYKLADLFTATAVLMAATLVALTVSWLLIRRIPIMPLVSGALVLVFGGLTLALNNDTFFKMKPTIANALFGTALLGGLAFGKPLLSVVFDEAFKLTETGWKKLTFRWGCFFFALALLNEIVWRTQTQDFWVNFKVWGMFPLTMAFAIAQTPLLMKHEAKDSPAE